MQQTEYHFLEARNYGDYIFVSLDIVSLFTNIPFKKTAKVNLQRKRNMKCQKHLANERLLDLPKNSIILR